MTWFSNSVAERALTLINQHMHDCELRATQVISRTADLEKKLEEQDRRQDEMHRVNTAALNKLMWLLVTTLAGMVATLGIAVVELKVGK